jgi:hypothetical protein
MKPIYSSHGGRHQVAVVHCPRITGNRLVPLSQDGPKSWVIRDFITGKMLRNSPLPNAATSWYPLAEIEAEVTYSEEPLFLSVAKVGEWKRHLEERTRAVLRIAPSSEPPNPRYGDWVPLF